MEREEDMRVPSEIALAARRGEVDVVKAWLDAAPRDLNQLCEAGEENWYWSLLQQVCTVTTTPGHVALMKLLLAHGADPNFKGPDYCGITALHLACSPCTGSGTAAPERVAMLINAGASISAISDGMPNNGMSGTPLGWALHSLFDRARDGTYPNGHAIESVRLLLRAGASISELSEDLNSQIVRRSVPGRLHACRSTLWAIHAAGSLTAYRRIPRKKILVLRSLVNRGRAKTEDPVMKFLCRPLGVPNGVVWNVLSYWRAFEPGAFEVGLTTVF